jgi:hypothetical protein
LYATRWSQTLRQGDVIGPLPFPKLQKVPQLIARPQGWEQDAQVLTGMEYQAVEEYCMVISHDCEFTEAKRDRFIVARIQDIDERWPSEKKALLLKSNNPLPDDEDPEKKRFAFAETYVLEPLEPCWHEARMVDFTSLLTLPRKPMFNRAKEMKWAELEHDRRLELRLKIAYFFGRGTGEDLPDHEKIAPYPPTDPPGTALKPAPPAWPEQSSGS